MALYTNIKGPVNYTTVGSPTIEDGVVSGLSSSNYLRINQAPDLTKNFILHFSFVSNSTQSHNWNSYILVVGSNKYLIGTNYQAKISFMLNNGGTSYVGNTVITANKKYIFEYRYNATSKVLSFYVDKGNGLEFDSSFSDVEMPSTSSINIVDLGCWSYSDYTNCPNSIDLNETYININNTAWFGTSFSKVKLHSPTAISYTKVGNPTITSDGIASGFTDKNDYLTLPAFSPSSNKWKFTTKVKFNSLSAQMSLIDRNSSTRCFQIVMRTTGKWRVNISNNGSSKANEVDGTNVCTINTIYYLSFEYDGSKYYLKFSLDNINWTTDITINNSNPIYSGATLSMGHSWYNSGTEKWDGDIYLRETHLEIQGQYTDTWKLHALEGDYAIVNDRLVWANPNIYLQSNENQYIDTGIFPDNTTGCCINFYTSKGAYNCAVGSRESSSHRFFPYWYENSKVSYGWDIFNPTDATLVLNNKVTASLNFKNDRKYIYNNNVINSNLTLLDYTSTKSIYLFTINWNGTARNGSIAFKGNLYSCLITKNANIVRHFVPVPTGLQIGDFTVPSNGMFDIVNQQFYPNQGTGTFTYGKDE